MSPVVSRFRLRGKANWSWVIFFLFVSEQRAGDRIHQSLSSILETF